MKKNRRMARGEVGLRPTRQEDGAWLEGVRGRGTGTAGLGAGLGSVRCVWAPRYLCPCDSAPCMYRWRFVDEV